MEEPSRGRPVEKFLYLPVLDLRRLRILGVFYTFHGSPEPGACGAVARIGVTAQADPLLRALEIRHFGSFDPPVFYTRVMFDVSTESVRCFRGKYRRNQRPHQEARGLAAAHDLGYLFAMGLLSVLPVLIVLIFSIVVHEVAHAWVALKEGDDTAYSLGRITLNPSSHLDPFGSFVVPLAMYLFSNGLIFGWAKPVPVDPRKFRDFRGGDIRVSMAGIVSNLILVVSFTLLVVVFVKLQGIFPAGESTFGFLIRTARFGIFINLILAFFNLIPIPPLDGSHVLYHFLPRAWRPAYQRAGQFGLLIVMGLVFLYPPFLSTILLPVNVLMGLADSFVELWI
jgi:Zn-dependent protease